MTLRPSTAPRWKIAISCLERPDAATAVRAMNDGAKPRLTNANAPFFRNTLRDNICISLATPERLALLSSLEFRCTERERHHFRRVGRLRNRRSGRLAGVAVQESRNHRVAAV